MSSPATVDVVIVNYRCAGDTLAALAGLTPWPDGTVWLIDNSEDPAEAERLARASGEQANVRLLVQDHNRGFGGGCNAAFAQSSAEFLLLLNPDARIAPADLRALVGTMQRNGRWGALSPRIFWDPARRFLLPSALPMRPATLLGMGLAARLGRWVVWPAESYLARQRRQMAGSQAFRTPFLAGSVMLLRREAVMHVGGLFDPDYFMFYEDSDLSLRLRTAGYRLGIEPRATAVHEYRHKASKLPLMTASEQVYYRKHFPLFYRATSELSRVGAIASGGHGIGSAAGDLGTVADEKQLRIRLGGHGVLALSPSPTLMPALFRPLDQAAVALSADDWQRLEAGRYWICCSECGDGQRSQRAARFWASFVKPGAAA